MSCITAVTEDAIRVELLIRAPRERVWKALTDSDEWANWFGDKITGDFQVGSEQILDFGKYGTETCEVVERIEGEVIAYRWHPGMKIEGEVYEPDQRTTCRFELSDANEGTRLVLTESGFAAIPKTRRPSAFKDNTEGWEAELAELVAWLEEGRRQVTSS